MEIDAWRRQQPDPMPNLSEAYRRLIEKGLDAEAKAKPKRRGHDWTLQAAMQSSQEGAFDTSPFRLATNLL